MICVFYSGNKFEQMDVRRGGYPPHRQCRSAGHTAKHLAPSIANIIDHLSGGPRTHKVLGLCNTRLQLPWESIKCNLYHHAFMFETDQRTVEDWAQPADLSPLFVQRMLEINDY